MSYTDNAPLITAWDNRVQALKDMIETLYDVTSHNLLFEDTSAEALLSTLSLDSVESPSGVMTLGNPKLVSNEQAPIVTLEAPQLVVEPEEGSDDPSDQEEEKEDTVEETVEETVDQEDETVEEPSDEETDETEEEEEITSEE